MNIAPLDQKLNAAILGGQALAAFDELYDDQVVMQENSAAPFSGKALNREREIAFFDSIAEFHGATLAASAVHGDVSFSEWDWDVTFKNGPRVRMNQVAVRRWKDGKVIHERFYYNKG